MRNFHSGTIVLAPLGISSAIAVSQTSKKDSEIFRALSAAPASIALEAAVVLMDAKGGLTELYPGSNGWTSLTHREDPLQPDTIEHHPACFDKYALEWIQAYEAGRRPNPEHVGYSYMLQSGSSWSNTEPSATKLAPGQEDFHRASKDFPPSPQMAARPCSFPSAGYSLS